LNSFKEKNFGIPAAIFIAEHGCQELTLFTSGQKDSIIYLGCIVPFFFQSLFSDHKGKKILDKKMTISINYHKDHEE
jgi:hypothetical protein